jgi:hypothetical protein
MGEVVVSKRMGEFNGESGDKEIDMNLRTT